MQLIAFAGLSRVPRPRLQRVFGRQVETRERVRPGREARYLHNPGWKPRPRLKTAGRGSIQEFGVSHFCIDRHERCRIISPDVLNKYGNVSVFNEKHLRFLIKRDRENSQCAKLCVNTKSQPQM